MLTVVASVLLVAVLVLVVLLVRQRGVDARARARCAELETLLHARDEEDRHLVRSRLPAVVESLTDTSVSVPGPLDGRAGDPHGSVLSLFAWHLQQTRAAAAQVATATLKTVMRTVQNLANEQQVVISAAEQHHDDPDVLADLLKIDHANSQLARRAQATAVLCGSWPGQQRSASTLTDMARGAASRIRDFPRVVIPAPSDAAVVSRAVEPVVLAVAELLDNGARHSQPGSTVEVNFQQAHNGLAIVIDDAGVGMTVEAVQRATWLLSGHGGQDIAGLGDPPRIGFAVVGVLAARYGFTVSVDTRSPYGGVRAVVFLPSELLTRVDAPAAAALRAPESPQSAVTPEPATATPVPAPIREPAPAPAADVVSRTEHGLPRRSRRTALTEFTAPLSPVPRSSRPVETSVSPAVPASPSLATLAAWQRGTQAGRRAAPPTAEFERDTP
ncbi:ATP-binding protein [Amycolatopsis sp. H20-H5]|uniref:ATP-binding protein n=1 Tax=Amycolatopsis sp. H20-H5 TaxID=3046309 RepID=UPI002DB8ABDA|nr:ATP-binding protein [Amycolatopsis sp. H20-H5]MEC3975863.1 ATP-binding protein [Amycolatopsis sp. H20-H5]